MFNVKRKMYTFALQNNDFPVFLSPNVCNRHASWLSGALAPRGERLLCRRTRGKGGLKTRARRSRSFSASGDERWQFQQMLEHAVWSPIQWLFRPVLCTGHPGGDPETNGTATPRHDHFDEWIVTHNCDS